MLWWELGLVNRHSGYEFSPVNLRCPYCSTHANFVRIFTKEIRGGGSDEDHTSEVWQCRHCSEVLFVQWHANKGMVDYRVFPQHIQHGLEDALPAAISTEFQQAISAYVDENWDITVVLLKRLIDLVAQEQGVQGKGLRESLEQLVNKGQLTQVIQEWATQIECLLQETSATKVATMDSARELLSFTRWVLDMIYLLPKTMARYR